MLEISIGITVSLVIGAIVYYNYRRKPDTKIQKNESERLRIPITINDAFQLWNN